MTVTPRSDHDPAAGGPDAADAAAYDDVRDGVLRGLAHELSNRTGTIGAVAEALVAADPASRLALALRAEAARLDEVLRLLRLLPADPARPAEPVRPADLVADAAALFALHPAGRDRTVALERGDDAPPVRAHVPATVHALVRLLVRASPDGATVAVSWREADGDVVLRVGDGELRLPTLAAARTRAAQG